MAQSCLVSHRYSRLRFSCHPTFYLDFFGHIVNFRSRLMVYLIAQKTKVVKESNTSQTNDDIKDRTHLGRIQWKTNGGKSISKGATNQLF